MAFFYLNVSDFTTLDALFFSISFPPAIKRKEGDKMYVVINEAASYWHYWHHHLQISYVSCFTLNI